LPVGGALTNKNLGKPKRGEAKRRRGEEKRRRKEEEEKRGREKRKREGKRGPCLIIHASCWADAPRWASQEVPAFRTRGYCVPTGLLWPARLGVGEGAFYPLTYKIPEDPLDLDLK
jgi:hypothetical protein